MEATHALRSMTETLLHSHLVQQLAERAMKVLDELEHLIARATGLEAEPAEEQRPRPRPKPAPPATPRAPAPAAKPSHPIPEMIHTHSGGKRVPANVAARAVRKSGTEFKPKKGQKK